MVPPKLVTSWNSTCSCGHPRLEIYDAKLDELWRLSSLCSCTVPNSTPQTKLAVSVEHFLVMSRVLTYARRPALFKNKRSPLRRSRSKISLKHQEAQTAGSSTETHRFSRRRSCITRSLLPVKGGPTARFF